ncbi:MAG TPA: 2,3-diphosphoglycerate synthetase [Actinomycetota bacterium]|nr:2,3-diphosphoglycerate synthetase [Actinomycetota bacterium]
MSRVLALVDGEHYPSTTRWGLFAAQSLGYEVAACLFLGGIEKLGADRRLDLGGVPVLDGGEDPPSALRRALHDLRPDAVLDLSDEPVLGYRERMLLAAVSLAAGIPYVGADFRLEPPITAPALGAPTLAVIGTGKRTGKTAIAGEAARVAAAAGLEPVVVAMGRGGPPEPQLAEAGSVRLDRLLELARRGEHAASDYLEDAVTTGVTTVGARRVGGGLAGAPFASNVNEAAQVAVRAGAGLVILEGSGSAIPTVPWDAGVLVSSAATPEEYLAGYLGPYRVLLSDLVVLTLGSGSDGGRVPVLTSHIRRLRPDARVVVAELKPAPLGEVRGKKVFFATTAPPHAGASLASHLEEAFGCTVVGVSHRLADRAGVAEDLDGAGSFEVLLTELKAAAVDVAAERALARGAEVVFADNRAETLQGDGHLPDLLLEAARTAVERARSEGRDRRPAGTR